MRTPTKSMQCSAEESSGSRLVAFNGIREASVTGKKAARFLIAGLPGWWLGRSGPGSVREEVHLSTVMQEDKHIGIIVP